MPNKKTKALEAIRERFCDRKGQGWVCEKLRDLAVRALDRGFTAGQVARAAGVSRQSVVGWARRKRRSGASVAPIELKVIESRVAFDMQWLLALNGKRS